jgi:hypothetical protein
MTYDFEFADAPAESAPAGDAAPGAKRRGRPAGSKNTPRTPRKPPLQAELEANIFLLSSMGGQMWTMRDPTCGPVLVGQSKLIAEALAEILCDYPDVAARMLKVTDFGKYAKLFLAVQPVAASVAAHHVRRPAVEQEEAGGYGPVAA